MLIPSPRHCPDDLRLWAELEACDRGAAWHQSISKRATTAIEAINRFLAKGPAYLSVSWGKDSVVVADMTIRAASIANIAVPPLVWVRVEPIANPDCQSVRDAFLSLHPNITYHEIVEYCSHDADGWHATGTLKQGFERAAQLVGTPRYISGVRADESGVRTLSARRLGVSTTTTCRPLIWWTVTNVFAWLARHDLPVHPVYAMLGNGRWGREFIRVASLGGRRGDGLGRAEWEREYYGDILRRLSARTATSR